MEWNPDTYEHFKKERAEPFFDLMDLMDTKSNLHVIDLGCGTGELTSKLLDYLEGSKILGIDASAEMLEKAEHHKTARLHFIQRSIEEQLRLPETYDLVFSNAALHWCENHVQLFSDIISKINKGGQLAVQMPSNHDYIVHQLLITVASREPYRSAYKGWQRNFSVLKMEEYAKILYQNKGSEMVVFEKVYPYLMQDAEAIYDWASGTAILPFIEHLPKDLAEQFKEEYKAEIKKAFPETPVFYPFKRIFLSAKF